MRNGITGDSIYFTSIPLPVGEAVTKERGYDLTAKSKKPIIYRDANVETNQVGQSAWGTLCVAWPLNLDGVGTSPHTPVRRSILRNETPAEIGVAARCSVLDYVDQNDWLVVSYLILFLFCIVCAQRRKISRR
jgi:hypothetical protein